MNAVMHIIRADDNVDHMARTVHGMAVDISGVGEDTLPDREL